MAQLGQSTRSKIKVVYIFEIALALALFAPNCVCGEVVYVHSQAESPQGYNAVTVATGFYGLGLKTLSVGTDTNEDEIFLAVGSKNTIAAIVTASALVSLERKRVLLALSRGPKKSIPLLISGVTATTAPNLLQTWSEGTVRSAEGPPWRSPEMHYSSDFPNFTRELTGEALQTASVATCWLRLSDPGGAKQILAVPGKNRDVPIFVTSPIPNRRVFVLSQFDVPQAASAVSPSLMAQVAELAPFMMFLRYSAGERAWHNVEHFANLTVDDAWLTEPYGNLNYAGLLQEMQKTTFHTTIAFIPWNFDRSDPGVVNIFRAHPDRFSICVHGNNHDHQEFYSYNLKSLSAQEADVRQAIARMERFRTLTQIPYDRVMIFPYELVPAVQTLEALKQYGFTAAANATNIPMASSAPPATDVLFVLKPVTLRYGNFCIARRYSAEAPIPESLIAVNAFLGNPLLFYVHESYFANGIDSFDGTARTVNRIIPRAAWRSLGEIVRHLYQVREREDHNFDVQVFSNDASLVNSSLHDAAFYVQKEESFSPPVRSVAVDGLPYPYNRNANFLTLRVTIPAGQKRDIRITYQNDLVLTNMDISKRDLRVNILRKLSDFRDLYVSRFRFGRVLTRYYYRDKINVVELKVERSWPLLLLLVALSVFGPWYFRRKRAETRKV